LPSYYHGHGGFLIAAAIDKYVYVAVTRPLAPGIHLNYPETEHAETIDQVAHRITREALKLYGDERPTIEITTFADVPAGTGLGSSGSFTTALLLALHADRRAGIDPRELAEQACHIEMDVLGEPIGKQDQYIAAYGGLTSFAFAMDGSVSVERFAVDEETRSGLENSLLLFFTGLSRQASSILKDQVRLLKSGDKAIFERFHFEKENALRSQEALRRGDLGGYGRLLGEHWDHKRKRLAGISNPKLDRWYDIGLENGALGGKLMGAGGGGFLMFLAEDEVRLRNAMRDEGLVELPFRFADAGTALIAQQAIEAGH
jgi:D-glycero-alpha-D-manno-heptose-7-phosphate kinase